MTSPITWTTAMFDIPGSQLESTLDFWLGVTGSTLSAWRGDDREYATLLPPDGDPYLRVQRSVSVVPRIHLDLHIAADPGYSTVAERATALGATVQHQAPHHVVLSSPGGYVFCLVRDQGEAQRPSPYGSSRGTSLVDQLTLDVQDDCFDAEVTFWSELTGWGAHTGSRSEFVALERPAGIPLRLMLQRLNATGDGAHAPGVTSHLDLATHPHREALTREHVSHGAHLVSSGAMWSTLTDPGGSTYCLTDRDPGTGFLPSAVVPDVLQ